MRAKGRQSVDCRLLEMLLPSCIFRVAIKCKRIFILMRILCIIQSHWHTQNSLVLCKYACLCVCVCVCSFTLHLSALLSFCYAFSLCACFVRICQFIAHTSALECQPVFWALPSCPFCWQSFCVHLAIVVAACLAEIT